MKDQIDYILANARCQCAIDEAEKTPSDEWLKTYNNLYNEISYSAGNLPSIADANFDGIRYTSILNFHSLYNKLLKNKGDQLLH